jgi:hypothetical protein
MLINVTSTDQTIYILISDVRASAILGDRGVASPKYGERKWTWSPGKFFNY